MGTQPTDLIGLDGYHQLTISASPGEDREQHQRTIQTKGVGGQRRQRPTDRRSETVSPTSAIRKGEAATPAPAPYSQQLDRLRQLPPSDEPADPRIHEEDLDAEMHLGGPGEGPILRRLLAPAHATYLSDMARELKPAHLAAARTLAIDSTAAEVVTAFRAAGIEPVLLKGKTVADWLYPGEVRPYGDVDLLVAPWLASQAESVLARLGFTPGEDRVSPHAHPWIREDGMQVDLHTRLFGLRCTPKRAWEELRPYLQTDDVAETPVRILAPPARALQVVLHAVQHLDNPKPQEDLHRALRYVGDDIWRATERLADRLDALHIVAHGLSLDPAGRELIERLPLVRAARLSDQAEAPLAVGIERVRQASGLRQKVLVLRRELALPDPELRLSDAELDDPSLRRAQRDAGSELRHLLALGLRLPKTLWALRRARNR
jgi:hypothetical protein